MVLKSDVKIAFKQQQLLLKGKPNGEWREKLAQVSLSKEFVLIITGIRRCGKSTFMQQMINKLKSSVAFFNFEDPRIFGFETTDFVKLDEVIGENTLYYFFDEVQNVDNWEIFIRNLHDKQKVICITGSNASLLSRELGTKLTGRNIQIELLPFSFKEYLTAREIDTGNKYLNFEALFFDYINETSLPKGVALRDGGYDKIYAYLEAIYQSIIEKDISQRYEIRETRAFSNIVKFVASNIGSILSPSNIASTLSKEGQNIHHSTIEKYLRYLEACFVFYKVNRFDLKGKKQLVTQEKYYLVDPGLLNILVGKERMTDRGHILENVVYLELIRRGNKVWTGTARDTEIDFVCKTPTGEIEYFQIAWQLASESTIEREFSALEKIKDNYPKYLLSTDSFTQNRSGIKHINVFEWLLAE